MFGLSYSDSVGFLANSCVWLLIGVRKKDTLCLVICSPGNSWIGTLTQSSLLAGGQWMVTERPAPSLDTQALEGMFCLQALGVVGTRFLVTEVHLSLGDWGRV